MQIINRPRKEGPSKNAMPLSHGILECDAANTGIESTKQGTHWKGECAGAKLLGAGPWGHGSKLAVSLIFDPEVRHELSPLPQIWSRGTTSLTWQQQPLWRKNCVSYPGRSLLQGHMCHRMICARIAVSWEKRMLWSACGCSRGRRSYWTYDTYRWRANTRKWDRQLQRPGAENRRKKGVGLDGRNRLSSLGQGPTMSPGGQGSAVI